MLSIKNNVFPPKRILQSLKGCWGRLLTAGIFGIAGSFAALLLPVLTGKIIDSVLMQNASALLNYLFSVFVGFIVFLGVTNFIQDYLIGSTGARLVLSLRSILFGRLVTLPPHFFANQSAGELLSRAGADLTSIQNFFIATAPTGLRAIISFVGAIGFLFYIDARMAIFSLIAIPPAAISAFFFGRWTRKRTSSQHDALARSTATAEEVLNGIWTVQALGGEQRVKNKYFESLGSLVKTQLITTRLSSGLQAILLVIQHASSLLILGYGAHLIIKRELSPGQLVAFMLYASAMGGALYAIANLYAGYQSMIGASERVFELMDVPGGPETPRCPVELSPVRGGITFRNVTFRYPNNNQQDVLNSMTLEIKPGEVVALVGPSGAGKSTVFSLLLRFYDPCSGNISLDGKDLRSVSLHDLRRAIGTVPQDTVLFSGTVAENINYFGDPKTPEEIRAASIAAGADAFIQKMPQKYNELIGARGMKLSAGQRQRIAIARAFLMNPKILLLDEATSSLDPDSETKVTEAVSNLLRGRTTLIIAHRLATVRRVDRIAVLDKGAVVAIGTHEVLYSSNAVYRRYWELQSLLNPGVS